MNGVVKLSHVLVYDHCRIETQKRAERKIVKRSVFIVKHPIASRRLSHSFADLFFVCLRSNDKSPLCSSDLSCERDFSLIVCANLHRTKFHSRSLAARHCVSSSELFHMSVRRLQHNSASQMPSDSRIRSANRLNAA